VAWFAPRDICFAPVNTLPEAFADPQIAARGLLLHDADGRTHVGSAIHYLHEPAAIDLSVPELGAHTAAILRTAEERT
jgi:crotonobetainyl-CoA:carnitine CoA-transferase CaiB-like acyl-CoA transferase